MARPFGIVDTKLEEAEYFLLKFLNCGWNFREAQFLFNAFASSTRSVTFALQASMKGVPGFEEWYAEWQRRLRASKLARFFHDCRTDSQKVGKNFVNGGISGPEGPILLLSDGSFEKQDSIPIENAFEAVQLYFRMICEIIADAYDAFGHVIDPDIFYSLDGIRRNGLTLEDIEEELGFPRGFTKLKDMGQFTDLDRISLLRRNAAISNCRALLAQYPKPPAEVWA